MAELVDAGDLKSPGLYGCAGSIPALGTFREGPQAKIVDVPELAFPAAAYR